MIEATCHCGAVRIEIADAPTQATSCNCSICRRLGALWAYYGPVLVRISGATAGYAWGDRKLEFRRCLVCGCTTHWRGLGDVAARRMGVNVRLLTPAELDGVRIRRFDGADTWTYLDDA